MKATGSFIYTEKYQVKLKLVKITNTTKMLKFKIPLIFTRHLSKWTGLR